jgi:hypothetical protein
MADRAKPLVVAVKLDALNGEIRVSSDDTDCESQWIATANEDLRNFVGRICMTRIIPSSDPVAITSGVNETTASMDAG